MGLCVIAGGSGAGKTEYIYRKIIELSVKEPEGRFFVVTPEQATMQAQKEIAFPTGYMVPPLSAVPIVRIFNESDAAPVWPCGGTEAFPHPPSARPVQTRNKEIMCENLCMKISHSLCVRL